MNLINDAWIQVQRKSGLQERVAPLDLYEQQEDPVVEVVAPRADFRGALYQMLIALLQTAFAPEDLDEWIERWEAPLTRAKLQAAFAPYMSAFVLDGDGMRFLQDREIADVTPMQIAALLIEAPGENTIKNNADLFVHRGGVDGLCPGCAATALLTLQINAPSGGQGHRVSVRGGGPLTTLRVPQSPTATLWQKLWANVLPAEDMRWPKVFAVEAALPWMGKTRTSEPDTGVATTPENVHPLQAYWSMPRRILLDFEDTVRGSCSVCATEAELVRKYRTRNYGTDYTGAWLHPLTPYSHDPKGINVPLSSKGQKGGIGYRHWLGLALGNPERQPEAAQVVNYFKSRAMDLPVEARRAQLWCFGFDFDNAKTRGYYDCTLPLYALSAEKLPSLTDTVKQLIDLSLEAALELQKQVKAAQFDRPGEVETDPAVQQSFWQTTESSFYELLDKVMNAEQIDLAAQTKLLSTWHSQTRDAALRQFDVWVLAAPIEAMKTRRVVQARANLLGKLVNGKVAKVVRQRMQKLEEVQA